MHASSARAAEFGIVPGSLKARMLDAEGHPEDRAGSHPDRLQIDFALTVEGTGTTARDLVFELPPGFSGNPSAVPQCPRARFEAKEECPPESQVGVFSMVLAGGQHAELPVFALEPGAGEALAFASKPGLELPLRTELRSGDFGITLTASELAQLELSEGHVELWGVPAHHQQGTAIAPRPFLTAPTRCGPLPFTLRVRSWQEGAPWLSETTDAEAPLVGCAGLAFQPALALQLDNPVADSPTGVAMRITTPEEAEASDLAAAQIEDAMVSLPNGVTVSPGGAQGLTACRDAQLGLGNSAPASCPADSQVGTVEFDSPLLSRPLAGALYLGEEHPDQRFRLFAVAPGPGLIIKFVAALAADPDSGRLVAKLTDLPQVPIRGLKMSFYGGSRALLASPLDCGEATAEARFAPYGGGPTVVSSPRVSIASLLPGTACSGQPPFAPELSTVSANPRAGSFAPFTVTLLRRGGEQLPHRFSISLPAGLDAALGRVKTCPEPSAQAGACPVDSRVGGVTAAVGSGGTPAVLRGDAYLTGPYEGAPFGLLIAVPATVGPFDLGSISFRAAARIGGDGRVTVSSDPLPQAIDGVPVRFRSIELSMDRPGLVRNPTACGPVRTDASLQSSQGASATPSSSLRLRGCRRLGFHPSFKLAFGTRGPAHKHSAVGLEVAARFRHKDANPQALSFSLPSALRVDVSGLEELCSHRDAAEGACDAGAKVGTASARTPLLDRPLRGSVYVAQPLGSGQPDLWIELAALGVSLRLKAANTIDGGHLVTRLTGLPDMPLSKLTMRLGSGRESLFSLAESPCQDGQPRRFEASLRASGQNGIERGWRLPVRTETSCGARSSQ